VSRTADCGAADLLAWALDLPDAADLTLERFFVIDITYPKGFTYYTGSRHSLSNACGHFRVSKMLVVVTVAATSLIRHRARNFNTASAKGSDDINSQGPKSPFCEPETGEKDLKVHVVLRRGAAESAALLGAEISRRERLWTTR